MKCMKLPIAIIVMCSSIAMMDAFTVIPKQIQQQLLQQHRMPQPSTAVVFSSSSFTTENSNIATARTRLVDLAERLKEEYGTFIVEKQAKQELEDAVSALENVSRDNYDESSNYNYLNDFLGDWTLVCTTAVSTQGVDTSQLPSFLKQLRDTVKDNVNKRLKVVQRIRSSSSSSSNTDAAVIDRVDNVLEYEPPEALKDLPLLFPIPEQFSKININPLQVSKSKVILVHKASMVSETMPLKTKLAWTSVVLNVAGTSTVLDPNGKDIASLNLPLGDFINTGEFETTYLDRDLRISRGKVGKFSDQLRIFVRSDKFTSDEILRDSGKTPVTDGKGIDSLIDVDDDKIDPTFEAEDDSSPEVVDDIDNGEDTKDENEADDEDESESSDENKEEPPKASS